MTLLRALGRCAVALALAAAGSRPAAAQSIEPLAERTLLTLDARDERAVWANPAGLARSVQASVAGDLTVAREAGDVRLAQFGAALSSRGLAFGWEHDRSAGGPTTDTYVLGLGLGDEVFSGGASHRWRAHGQGSWDVGLRGRVRPWLDLSLVWREIGSPLVQGVVLRDRFVPGAGIRLFGDRLLAGAEGVVPGDLGNLTEAHAGATVAILPRVTVSYRATFSRDPARRGAVVVVGIGARAWRGAAASVFSQADGLTALGADAAVVGDLAGGRSHR